MAGMVSCGVSVHWGGVVAVLLVNVDAPHFDEQFDRSRPSTTTVYKTLAPRPVVIEAAVQHLY